ncbi:MAG: hypothetical protein EBE86_001385 [Hormoscilla sp. GUM202]|nr:hypothetical protein [Hormoscilla sp. GUM202]
MRNEVFLLIAKLGCTLATSTSTSIITLARAGEKYRVIAFNQAGMATPSNTVRVRSQVVDSRVYLRCM